MLFYNVKKRKINSTSEKKPYLSPIGDKKPNAEHPFEKSFNKRNEGIFKTGFHFPLSKGFNCEKPTHQISPRQTPQHIQVRTA
jgi:hypothetical protein